MDPRPRTLVEKIWDDHVVAEDEGAPSVLAVDLHLVHEVTSPQAFTGLRERGLTVRHPERTVATGPQRRPAGSLSWIPSRRRRSSSSTRTAASSGSRSTGSAIRARGSSTSSG